MRRAALPLIASLVLLGPGCAGVASGAVSASGSTRPQAYSTRPWAPVTMEAVFDAAARADLVFVGEQHDDAGDHAFELRLLQALAEHRRPVVLAMEMFERDVQPRLDDYLAGRIDEAAMLAGARPWPNYARDYRPLVEFARAQGWPVIAGNAPRPLAARIARDGLEALDQFDTTERRQIAAELVCPDDAYKARFEAAIADLPPAQTARSHGVGDPPAAQRLYESQCAKDETMAEAAVAAMGSGRTVVHLNGEFHSDERGGVVQRAVRRAPKANLLVLSLKPRAELDGEPVSAAVADYVVQTP